MAHAPTPAHRTARRRDRRVYTRAHPLLFTLLAAARRRPVARLGGTLLVHDAAPYRHALTHVPLDRTAAGTTGGAARALVADGALFDEEGQGHRETRRGVAGDLGAAGVARLRPVWQEVLDRRLRPLATGETVDLVSLARELAGSTVVALLGVGEAKEVAEAAAQAAAATVRAHLPGPTPPGDARAAALATARLEAALTVPTPHTCPDVDTTGAPPPAPAEHADPDSDPAAPHGCPHAGSAHRPRDVTPGAPPDAAASTPPSTTEDDERPALRAILAVAAVNTTVAALPRAAAWCADAGLWSQAEDAGTRARLVDELLRVTAPSPLLPRVAAADAEVGGCPVRAGERLILVARHAVRAHNSPPDAADPAPAREAQLVFGAGPHACPGARLARAQLADLLAALAPHHPTVVRARPSRRAALPSWRTLTVRATSTPAPGGTSARTADSRGAPEAATAADLETAAKPSPKEAR